MTDDSDTDAGGSGFDRTDMGILFPLQRNARDTTAEEISEHIDIAPSTVAARIRDLEDEGIIKGYIPVIDYGKTGFDHTYVVIGTGPQPLEQREEFVDDILDVHGVVAIRELSTDEENFSVEIVGRTQTDIFESLAALNAEGLTINRIEVVRQEKRQPFDHFGKQFTDLE
ncbi:MAG: Lrp/AsnC family transcriptional regulator [Haloarculaceae archaeon]